LPPDAAGNYRNFLKLVAAPPELAESKQSTLEAVLASYVLNMKAVQDRLAQRDTVTPQQTSAKPPRSSVMAQNHAASRAAPAGFQGGGPRSLQQQINAEIAAGGFSPQMVAAMRAQANAQAGAVIAPIANQMRSFNQGIDYFDRSVLRGQIPN
jgi:hypothetical protein